MNSRKLIYLAACIAASVTGQLRADQQIADNLELTGVFTLRQDAYLEGGVWLGKLPSSSTPGFKIEVTQESTPTEHEDVIPGHYENQTVLVDDYGWLSQATTTWVEEYGWYNQQIWVEDWGFTNPEVWVDTTYDAEGNMVQASHWETSPTPVYGVVGGHWETVSAWGVTGGHHESSGEDVWGITGSHEAVQPVWQDEVRTSNTTYDWGTPQTKFIAQAENMVWSWHNEGRKLVEVSKAGVHVPLPGDTTGSNNAMFTSTQFEQSYTTPVSVLGDYLSYGTKLSKEGIEGWSDTGIDQTILASLTAKLKPNELLMQKKVPAADGASVTTVGTRIAATDASFGGSVTVQGAVLIHPQGDIGMGAYTNGPRP
jgi:hypothetical protein